MKRETLEHGTNMNHDEQEVVLQDLRRAWADADADTAALFLADLEDEAEELGAKIYGGEQLSDSDDGPGDEVGGDGGGEADG